MNNKILNYISDEESASRVLDMIKNIVINLGYT